MAHGSPMMRLGRRLCLVCGGSCVFYLEREREGQARPGQARPGQEMQTCQHATVSCALPKTWLVRGAPLLSRASHAIYMEILFLLVRGGPGCITACIITPAIMRRPREKRDGCHGFRLPILGGPAAAQRTLFFLDSSSCRPETCRIRTGSEQEKFSSPPLPFRGIPIVSMLKGCEIRGERGDPACSHLLTVPIGAA